MEIDCCYICGCSLTESNTFELLFEETVPDGGGTARSLADILSKILGCKLENNRQTSTWICTPCVVTLETYESLEQQLDNLRCLVLNTYNLMTREDEQSNSEVVSAYDGEGINMEMTSSMSDLIEEVEEVDFTLHTDEISCDMVNAEPNLHSNDKTNNFYETLDSFDVIIDEDSEFNEADQSILDDENILDSEETNSEKATGSTSFYAEKALSVEGSSEESFDSVTTSRDRKYICKVCTPQTTHNNLTALKQHRDAEHNVEICTCEICGQVYKSLQDLHNHMDTSHEGITFNNFSNLCIHMKGHDKPFVCKICQKGYTNENTLKYHMRKHNNEGAFKCDQCGKVFSSNSSLNVHLETHTLRTRNFACNQCNKKFLKEATLHQHLTSHTGVKSFTCQICKKGFQTKHTLCMHMVTHSGLKPFICPTCGKTFARRNDLRDHERVHTGERPFKCTMCPAAFAQRSNLASHTKSTHLDQKGYKCDQCGREFKRRRLLDYHMKSTHTGERPIVCTMCSATFVYPEYYKRHMLIHSGVKPFACEICGKAFHSRENRNAHRFVHCNKKPYECLECGEGFMRKPQLLTHLKISQHSSEVIIKNEPQITSDLKQSFDTEEEPGTSTDMIVISQRISIKN